MFVIFQAADKHRKADGNLGEKRRVLSTLDLEIIHALRAFNKKTSKERNFNDSLRNRFLHLMYLSEITGS